ncbi:MAG TPA: glycine oxidase ThiO [Mycobacteriales bacterium]|nr:glycine oxidase ThiO [Mycobacteriales bacterium]
MPHTADVIVIGGGVIGTATAWRLALAGATVTLVDPRPGTGATETAAGMLAPVTELHYGEEPLLHLNMRAAAGYAEFVGELEQSTGADVGYRRTGTVVAAWDGGDLSALRDLHRFQLSLGLRADLLSAADLRSLEPSLAPGLPGGLYAGDDHAVDPRRLHAALLVAADSAGVHVERQAAMALAGSGAVTGALLADGSEVSAALTVLAAGARSATIAGPAGSEAHVVRPVKGQTLRLRLDHPDRLSHVTRGWVRGNPVYLVPRADGELIVGASSEEAGYDEAPRAGVIYELLRDAQALLPGVMEMQWREVSTGLRPGTPDNAPLIGPASIEGLVLATGHYRNGVLLAAVTAEAVARVVLDGSVPEWAAPFGPGRFASLVAS